MATESLDILIRAKTDEFAKSLSQIKTRAGEVAAQVKEIDKQLKTESADKAQKLSEKLALVQREAALAEKQARAYADQIKQLSDSQKNGTELTEKQKAKIESLASQMDVARQKAATFTAQASDLQSELAETGKSAEAMGDGVEDFAESAEEGAEAARSFGDALMSKLVDSPVVDVLKNVWSAIKNIAAAAWDAAKAVAQAVGNYAKDAVEMAAGYEDQLGYSEQVFKNNADAVAKWVKDNSIALHTSQADMLEMVNTFGSVMTSVGMSTDKVMTQSKGYMTLAADLSAATGKSVEEVFQSLQSVMTGGYEAGKKYGIVINEASVKTYALSHGIAEVNDELTAAQKAEAVYGLVMEQTAHIQGQAAREAGSYTNQIAQMGVVFDNLKLSIGEKLLPVFSAFVSKLNEFAQSKEGADLLNEITEGVGRLADQVMGFVENGGLETLLDSAKEKLPEIAEAVREVFDSLAEIVPKVADLTEKVVDFFSKREEAAAVKEAYAEAQGAIHEFAEESGARFKDVIKATEEFAAANDLKLSEVYGSWETYEPQIATLMENVGNKASEMNGATEEAMNGTSSAVQSAVSAIGSTDLSPLDSLLSRVRSWADGIASAVSNAWNWLKQAASENSFIDSGGNERKYGRASGGPVKAGQLYQVNDDHGRRTEMFVPAVDGYILNGGDTQRVVNNSDSHNVGAVNVYVTSYGTDAGSIAEEIGAAVQRKMRYSGAW